MCSDIPGAGFMHAFWRWLSGLLFYLLALAAAAACVAASLGPQPGLAEVRPQAGLSTGHGWRFGLDALQHAENRGLDVYVPRSLSGRPRALRVALHPGGAQAALGLRLILAPALARRVSGRNLLVEVDVRPLEVTTAKALAVGVEGGAWVAAAPDPSAPKTLRFQLSAPSSGASALWLRPVPHANADYAFGVEIAEVRLTAL